MTADDFWFLVSVVALVIVFVGLVLMVMKAINNG
jgi:uncharacterized membrane protein YhdT